MPIKFAHGFTVIRYIVIIPESKVYGANMGSTWGRQESGGAYARPMNLAIWDALCSLLPV